MSDEEAPDARDTSADWDVSRPICDAVTRRTYLAASSAVVGGLLAGCSSESDPGNDGTDAASDPGTETPSAGVASPTAAGTARTPTPTATPGTVEACMEPVGCVSFDSPPETYIVNNGEWADMAFALGQRDGFLTATNMIPGYLFEPFGLDVGPISETSALSATNWDKELFYELDPDVILMDPNYMHATGWDGSWDESDTAEVRDNVAPFFGNNILRRRDWHDYKLYTLYEAFEKLADLFGERDRYEALADVHDAVKAELGRRLPPEDERPSVALINSASSPAEGTFYPMHTRAEGVETKPYRDLGVESTFSRDVVAGTTIDYETLLEIDPERIIVHWGVGVTGDGPGFSPSAFQKQYVEPLEDHPVGSTLTAVENGEVYPGPFGSQGPLVNLLQTELLAQQFYPDVFGQFDPKRFPDAPGDPLFDRQRVRDVVQGNL